MKEPISRLLKTWKRDELRQFYADLLSITTCAEEIEVSSAAFKIILFVLVELKARKDDKYINTMTKLLEGKVKVSKGKILNVS